LPPSCKKDWPGFDAAIRAQRWRVSHS